MDDTDSVVDGDYLGAYSRFFTEFVARVNPDDQLPVKVSAYDIDENELVGEIISVTLQYLNKTYCPPSLQSYIVHLVIQAIKSTCKKRPQICGLRQKTYAPLKLMQAVTNEVNEICRRYLDNSRLALLPPPSSTPQVTVGATKNARRKMEDRHMILHDLHTIFNIQDDTIANYYAVFDGHGGQDAAAYCATHLHQYLVESVHYPTDPEAALRDAFLTTDQQFIAKSSTQKLNGGTTAVCTLLLNRKLYIAWVGDSMASLVSHGNVKQLVNPHRPAREDENERIRNMGGVVVRCMGVLRVNGFLSISRAIGDVPYKPYVSGEPEVRCVSLDGTEDFLIIACDGLWDYVDQRSAALRVYRQVLQNPYDLKHVHQALLQSAKRAGSLDNITVIVVFLTPPVEIASRHSLLTHPAPNGLLLNNMDPNNPVSSNSGQFDVNAAFIKQQQQQQQQQLIDAELHDRADFDLNRVICGMARNGKHQDGDGNDDDYDYSDLGPETDVDAGEDAVDNHHVESLVTSSSSREFEKLKPMEVEFDNSKNDKEDQLRHDNANVCLADSVINDNRVELSERVCYDESNNDDDYQGEESRVESTTTIIATTTITTTTTTTATTGTLVDDDDDSPPSPRVAKSLQHALIPEAENVADSEDSEDEWNYYRVDPNKKESTAVTTGESIENIEEQRSAQNSESVPRDNSAEVQSSKIEEVDVKCEGSEIESLSSKLINIDISYEKGPSESEKKDHGEKRKQTDDDEEDMDFQLNPEAAEFVPLSPPLLNNRNNALQDYPISGSPLKQTPAMDDILIPSQSEFEKEVCLRPKEIDEDFSSNDEQPKHASAACDNNLPDMDVSEISSTKVEVDDDSMARNVSTTQWQTDISQWSTTTRNDAGSDSEEYDVINRDNDPMTMSFTPGDLEAAFEKGVDLNAVHELDDSSDDAENVDDNDASPRSPDGQCANEDVRARTPLSDDKGPIDLLSSSTPHPADSQSQDTSYSVFMTFKESISTEQQLGVAPLADDQSSIHTESIVSRSDNSQSVTSPFEMENNESNEYNLIESLLPAESTQEVCGENLKLMEELDKAQNEEEQILDLCEKVDRTQSESHVTLSESVPFDSEIKSSIDQNQDSTIPKSDRPPLNSAMSEDENEVAEDMTQPWKKNANYGKYLMSMTAPYDYEPPRPQENILDKKNEMMPNRDDLMGFQFKVQSDSISNSVSNNDDSRKEDSVIHSIKNQCNDHPDKFEKDNYDDAAQPNSIISSDSQKDLEIEEKPNQSEGPKLEEDGSSVDKSLNNVQTELKLTEISASLVNLDETFEKQIASEDIPTSKEEVTKSTEKPSPEIIAKTNQSKERKVKAKASTTSTTTKRPTNKTTTTTSTTKVTSTTKTKAATPTSPTKTIGSITSSRTAVTSSAAQKKPIAARPKQLADSSAKTATSSASGKISSITKTTTSSRTATTTPSTTTAMKTSVSPRVSAIKSKVNTTAPTSSRLSASATSTEKRSTTNKIAGTSAKVGSSTTKTTTNTKTVASHVNSSPSTIAKTSTVSNASPKPRATSAGTTAKMTLLTTSLRPSMTTTTTTTSTRPKTAPSTVAKPRDGSAKAATQAKSPLIDKQSKDTVNKQISRSSVSPKSNLRTSLAKSRLTGKLSGAKAPETAISPTKRQSQSPPLCLATRSHNSISNKKVTMLPSPDRLKDVLKNMGLIPAPSDDPEDDAPRKDASSMDVPTDNQLIVTD